MTIVTVLLPQHNLIPLDYLLPVNLSVRTGDLVTVPFRASQIMGIVWSIKTDGNKQANFILKEIKYKLGIKLSSATLKLIAATAQYYLASLGSVAKLVLPIEFKPKTLLTEQAGPLPQFNLPILNAEQQKCFMELKHLKQVMVLQGPTGSGKTEVYLYLIAEALKKGQQILVLLPEIALTTQIIQRFTHSLNFQPEIWHSAITKSTKQKIFAKLLTGTPMLVVGARSSLFLPYKNLGLIIIDEEHSESYKQDAQVPYHARDIAGLRSRFEEIPVVLCSATPSLETYYQIQNGNYYAVALTKRYHEVAMPKVEIIDMLKAHKTKGHWLSLLLVEAINQNLKAGGQTLLFLNRRGYAPLMLCDSCGFRIMCVACTVWLVMYKAANKLVCNHCGYTTALVYDCQKCGTRDSLVACGPGIEKIEEEVRIIFPQARIITASSDNMATPKDATSLIEQISNLQVDIIIGTQIITKGYHFPHLKLVGVIDADLGLIGGDLRAAEKNFQLLQQVGGRAGRESAGKVLVQTRSAQNIIFAALRANDLSKFIEYELKIRKTSYMPPFSKMVNLILRAKKEVELLEFAKELAVSAPQVEGIRLLGPSSFTLNKINNYYRVRILLIGPKNFNFSQYFTYWFAKVKLPSWVNYKIDVDPYNFT